MKRSRAVAAALVVLLALVAGAVAMLLSRGRSPRPGVATATCRDATPASLASLVVAAAPGQSICLETGDYGSWKGTDKPITLTAARGARVALALSIGASARDFTIDGTARGGTITIRGGAILGAGRYTFDPASPHGITIMNANFTAPLTIDYIVDNGSWPFTVALEHDTFDDINYNGGRIRLPYNDNEVDSGVVVENSTLANGAADGINAGAGITILNNDFGDITEGAYTSYHTDSIQVFGRGAAHTIIRGNWIHGGSDGIAAYDGIGNATIEDNVISSYASQRCIELYYDNAGTGYDPSRVEHNTLYQAGDGKGCTIDLDTKPGVYPPGSGTVVVDNIVPGGISLSNGSTASVISGNMCQSPCGAADFVGTAIFAGGARPTTYAGFRLAHRSPGTASAAGIVGRAHG